MAGVDRPTEVPVITEAIWHDMWVTPNDTDPTDLTGKSVTFPSPDIHYSTVDRHNGAVNVVFADGHASNVDIRDLYGLRWNLAYTPRDNVVLP